MYAYRGDNYVDMCSVHCVDCATDKNATDENIRNANGSKAQAKQEQKTKKFIIIILGHFASIGIIWAFSVFGFS